MFEILGEKCTKLVKDQGHIDDLAFAMAWIMVREYRRVHGSAADMQAWDDTCKKAWDAKALNTLDPDAQTQKDIKPINDLMNASNTLYGWDRENCTMAWAQFAGFVNWAVKEGPAKIAAMAKVAKPGEIGDVWMDNVALKDPAYASDWAKPGQAAPAKRWTPWIVGGVVVAGIGTVAALVATGKIKNPVASKPNFVVEYRGNFIPVYANTPTHALEKSGLMVNDYDDLPRGAKVWRFLGYQEEGTRFQVDKVNEQDAFLDMNLVWFAPKRVKRLLGVRAT